MRFYWKELTDPNESGIACKIMRAVEFPFKLDIREFCTSELQQEMNVENDRRIIINRFFVILLKVMYIKNV